MSTSRLQLLTADPTTPQKPWQRLAVLLFANGTPISDVCLELSKDQAEVTEFITSERGAAILKAIIGDNEDRLFDLLEAAAIDSVLALMRIRDTAPSPQARVAAACQLLDRASPKVKSQDAKTRAKRQSGDFAKVKNEIRNLREELTNSLL